MLEHHLPDGTLLRFTALSGRAELGKAVSDDLSGLEWRECVKSICSSLVAVCWGGLLTHVRFRFRVVSNRPRIVPAVSGPFQVTNSSLPELCFGAFTGTTSPNTEATTTSMITHKRAATGHSGQGRGNPD